MLSVEKATQEFISSLTEEEKQAIDELHAQLIAEISNEEQDLSVNNWFYP